MLPDRAVTTMALRHSLVMHEPVGETLDFIRLRAFTEEVGEALCGRTGRILVDGRSSTKDYFFADAYRLVQAFRDAPGFQSGHVAIAGHYHQDFEKAQALQFYFQEAGIDVRAFLDYEQAEAWLLGDDPTAGRA